MATLYRCKTPTNVLCRCGTVARRLRKAGIDFDEVHVSMRKSDRPEVEALSDQRWVPVFVQGEDVISDSHRILEYIEWRKGQDG
jgi:glutathione S-transferase